MRPDIAKMNGVDWGLFKSNDEAEKATNEMIAFNREQNPWIVLKGFAKQDQPSKACPLLCSKFYYSHRDGSCCSLQNEKSLI